jgi:hypothetical protein
VINCQVFVPALTLVSLLESSLGLKLSRRVAAPEIDRLNIYSLDLTSSGGDTYVLLRNT